VYDWDPNCLHYWGIVVYSIVVYSIVVYSVLIWLELRLKRKTMFSKWSTVLKCTVKLELTVK